jgi:hypothetical protein
MAAGQGGAYLVDSVRGGSATEGDYAVFTVELSGNDIPTTVGLELSSGFAIKGVDFLPNLEASFDAGATWTPVPANGQLPVAAGVGSFQVRTLTLTDNVFERDEIFGLFAGTGRSRFGTATILDKPTVSKFISISDASAVEGQKEVFTVSLSETTVAPTTVQFTLASGDAFIGKDFSSDLEASFDGGQTWTLVSANGQLPVGTGVKDFQVRTTNLLDGFVEQNEVFRLTATFNGENANGIGTIIDTPPVISIVNDAVYEGEKSVFTIGFTETTTAPTTIEFSLAGLATGTPGASATLGADFSPDLEASFDGGKTWTPVPANCQLAVGAGVKEFQVRTQIIADGLVESEVEEFELTVVGNGGRAVGRAAIRDGVRPSITVSDASAIEGNYEVFTVGLSNFTVPPSLELNLTSETATVGNGDENGNGTVGDDVLRSFEVSLDNGITWESKGSFLDLQNGVKDFKVRTMALTDNLVEGNETFKLTVSNVIATQGIGTGTIIDKPPVTPKVVSVGNASGIEGETEVFTIGLSDTTFEPTNIQLNLSSGTATLGKDFSATLEASFDSGVTWNAVPTNGQLAVGAGIKDFQVRTMALIDNRKEAAETFTLTASSNGGTANGTGTIIDTPIAAKVVRVSNARAVEGEQEVFTVGLSNKTTVPTTVELNLASGTATLGTDFSATLEASFDRGKTWSAVPGDGKLQLGSGIKDFQVRAMTTIDSLLKEGKETFKLTASANGGTADGTGTIVDKRFVGAIAIDLNGDGIQTIGIDEGVKFDITNSGEKLSTGWISNADAFLAFDRKIDSRAELFGGGVGQGFATLESFDSNRDGFVNAKDTRFDKLKVWQDKNSDGITDCNELFSLADVGIVSLKVAYTSNFTLDAQQNILGERSLATTNTGKTLELVDTYFQVASSSNFLSTYD